jgi:hypothetical protein
VHNDGHEESYLLGYNTMKFAESQPTFRGNTSPLSSESNIVDQARNESEADDNQSYLLQDGFLLDLHYWTRKMEVTYSPEKSFDFQRISRRCSLEDTNLYKPHSSLYSLLLWQLTPDG